MGKGRGRARTALVVALSLLLGQGSLPAAIAIAWGEEAPRETTHIAEANSPQGDVVLVAADEAKEVGKVDMGENKSYAPKSDLAILKDAGFDFLNVIFPVQFWTDTDGTEVFAVGIDAKNTALWKDIISGKANVWNQALDKFDKRGKENKGSFKPIFEVSALYKSNKQQDKEKQWGEAAVLLGIAGQKQGQYFIFTGEVSFTGMGGLKVPFSYSTQNGVTLGGASLDLLGKFTPKIAGGVGVQYLGRLGVYGTGTLSAEGRVLPKSDAGWNYVRLNAEIGLEVIALIWRVWHKDLWHTGDKDLIDPRPVVKAQSEDDAMGPSLEPQATDDVIVVPIVAQSVSGDWGGDYNDYDYVDAPWVPDTPDPGIDKDETYDSPYTTNELSTPQRGLRRLRRNVYPDTQVEMVSVPGGAVMCWLESTASDANPENSTRLMWSRYDEAKDSWSDPALVCTGQTTATADFEPDLFADDQGNVHAVWLNAESVITQKSSNINDAMGMLNVSYAKLAAGAKDFSAPEVVEKATGSSDYFRTSPEVAAVGDDVLVSWSTTRLDHMLDYGSDHKVVVAKGTKSGSSHTWTSRSYDYDSRYEITSLDAGRLGGEPAVAWTTDDLSIVSEGEFEGDVKNGTASSTLRYVTYSGASSEPHTISRAEHADFATKGTKGALTWTEPGLEDSDNLCAISDAGESPQLLKENTLLPPNFQVEGNLAGNALITYPQWEGAETTEKSTTDIYGRTLTQGTMISDEYLLVSHANDLNSHDVAYVNGRPLVAVAAERGVGGQSMPGDGLQAMSSEVRSADLLVARGDSLERLSVIDHLYDVDDVRPGATVETYVTVSNEGLTTIDGGVNATIIDDRTGAVLGRNVYGLPIAVDEDVDVPVRIRVPADFDPRTSRDISIKVNFEGPRAEDSVALNLDSVLIGQDFDPDADSLDPSPWSPTPAAPSGYHGGSTSSGSSYSTDSSYTTDSANSNSGGSSSASSATGRVARNSGTDRYETMAATVSSAFSSSDWVIVASGEGFADALAALSLAGVHNAPVILTASGSLSKQAKDELARLGCTHVVVVGGSAAVSEAVLSELGSLVGDVSRLDGTDRYETSLALLREARSANASSDTLFVATGTSFADALSVGPVSWKLGAPVVLAGADGTLSEAAVAAIKADAGLRHVVILGGAAAVSDAVRTQLGEGYEYERLGGANRYETSLAIAQWASSHGLGWSKPYLATGRGFADALAGAAAAGSVSSCLLLVDDSSTYALAGLRENASAVSGVTILGGTEAVSAVVEEQVRDALK